VKLRSDIASGKHQRIARPWLHNPTEARATTRNRRMI
jgi:hypothetical protein